MISVTKKISLSYIGEDWKDCYLEFKIPTVRQVQDAVKNKENEEYAFTLMADLFMGGMGMDDQNKKVEIKKDDILDLPITLINRAFKELTELDPN